MSRTKKIIEMISEGKISPEDGEKLIRAIKEGYSDSSRERSGQKKRGGFNLPEKLKTLNRRLTGKIVIDISSSSGEEVKINLPLRLAGMAMNMIPRDRIDILEREGINLRDTLDNISEIVDGIDEDIVNITSSNGDKVRIYIEK
ncbi:hypothetical protein KKA14_15215 [bacterium]|nr:hypothetical protein [bacterium]